LRVLLEKGPILIMVKRNLKRIQAMKGKRQPGKLMDLLLLQTQPC
jgi:hypothetical protein